MCSPRASVRHYPVFSDAQQQICGIDIPPEEGIVNHNYTAITRNESIDGDTSDSFGSLRVLQPFPADR